MHGLERQYSDEMAFERRNAHTAEGARALDAYGLRGHPSYVLAAPDGAVLWSALGVIEGEVMEAAIEAGCAARGE